MILTKLKQAILLVSLFISLASFPSQGQYTAGNTPQPGKQVNIREGLVGDVIDNYWIYLPRNFEKSRSWPMILFLQGGNGISPDSTTSKVSGPARFALADNKDKLLDSYVKDSFIIINPHMRPGSYWERQWYQQYSSLSSILDYALENFAGDPGRIYVTGLSRGGNGTWGVAQSLNSRIAAVLPVCGLTHGLTDYTCFKDLPVWITHGTDDQTHTYEASLAAADSIEEVNGVKFLRNTSISLTTEELVGHKYIFTTFEGTGHNAWTPTYSRAEIYAWLLMQTK
jgi:predicted peptidase